MSTLALSVAPTEAAHDYITRYLTAPDRACPLALPHVQLVTTNYWPRGAWCIPNHHVGGAVNLESVFARPLHYDEYTEEEKLSWLIARKKTPEKDKFPKAVTLGANGWPVKGKAGLFIGPTAIKLLQAGKKEVIFVEAAPVSEQVSQLLNIPCLALGGCWNGTKTRGVPKRELNAVVKELIKHYNITSVNIWFDYDADKKTIVKVSQGANQFESQLHEDFKGLSVRILRPHLIDGLCDTKSEPAVQLALFAQQGVMPPEAWKKLCETGLASTESLDFFKVENHYKMGSDAIEKVDEAMRPFLILNRQGLKFLQKSRPIDDPLDLIEFSKQTKHIKVPVLNLDKHKRGSLSVADCIEWCETLRSKYVVARIIRNHTEAEGLILDPDSPLDVVYNSPIPLPQKFKQPDENAQAQGKELLDRLMRPMFLVNDPLVVEDAFKTAWWAYHNPGLHPGIHAGFFGGEGSFKTSWSLAFGLPFGINKNALPPHYKLAGVEPEHAFGMFGQLPAEKFSHDAVGRSVACVWDETMPRPPAVARALKSAATSAAETREMNKAQRTLEHGQLNVFNGRMPPYLVEVNGSNRRERWLKLLGYGTDTYKGRVLDAAGLGELYGLDNIKDMSELKAKLLAPAGKFIAQYPLYIYTWIEERWPDVVDYDPFMPVAAEPKFPLAFYDVTEVARRIVYEIPPFPVLFGVTINPLLDLGYPQHTNPPVSAADLKKVPNYLYSNGAPQTHLSDPTQSGMRERIQTPVVVHKNWTDVWFNYLSKPNAQGLPAVRWYYNRLICRLVQTGGALAYKNGKVGDDGKPTQVALTLTDLLALDLKNSANAKILSAEEREILAICNNEFNCDLVKIAQDFFTYTGSREDEVY